MTREEIIANKANLSGANLRGANLRGADLWGANLRGANLEGANLREANLGVANLRGANLEEANLRGVNLSGANLWRANLNGAELWGANLNGANLNGANLNGANLNGADLRSANLEGADLRGAKLREADLEGADLKKANLEGVDLEGAKIVREQLHPLWGMKNYPIIYGYKLVDAIYQSPYKTAYTSPPLTYEIGKEVEVNEWDEDERVACGAGINLATLDWCLYNKVESTYKILLVSHTWEDVVCIPLATDGKYRVKRCHVLKEITPNE